jgi:flagellar basal-body rod protein FlgB
MSEISGIFNTPTTELVLRALDTGVLRHAVLAANIANASVEGYRPLRVSFEDQLAAAKSALLSRNDAAARSAAVALEAQVVPDPANRSVELDREFASMTDNSVRYQALLAALGKNSSLLRLAIREGRN